MSILIWIVTPCEVIHSNSSNKHTTTTLRAKTGTVGLPTCYSTWYFSARDIFKDPWQKGWIQNKDDLHPFLRDENERLRWPAQSSSSEHSDWALFLLLPWRSYPSWFIWQNINVIYMLTFSKVCKEKLHFQIRFHTFTSPLVSLLTFKVLKHELIFSYASTEIFWFVSFKWL